MSAEIPVSTHRLHAIAGPVRGALPGLRVARLGVRGRPRAGAVGVLTSLALGLGAVTAAPAHAELTCLDSTDCGGFQNLPFVQDVALPDDVRNLTVLGDVLLFTGVTEEAGREVWRTDGTAAGTSMVVDLRPGPADGVDPIAGNELVVMGGFAHFVGDDGVGGAELWRTDGTAAGTDLVAEPRTGAGSSEPRHLTVAGDRLYFQATTNGAARSLWVSDGTPAGTRTVTPAGGVTSVVDAVPVPVGDNVYFAGLVSGVPTLAVTDGTAEGTQPLTAFPGGITWFSFPRFPVNDHRLLAPGDRLFFVAATATDGRELWTSDGTAGGTVQVADVRPGATDSQLAAVGTWNGLFHFTDRGGATPHRLLTTDGTDAGTVDTGEILAFPGRNIARTADALVYVRDTDLVGSIDASGSGDLTLGKRALGGDVVEAEGMQGIGSDAVIRAGVAYVTGKSVQDRIDAVYAVDLATRRTTSGTLGTDTEIGSGPVEFAGRLTVAAGSPGGQWHLWSRDLPPDPEAPPVGLAVALAGTPEVGRTVRADTTGSETGAVFSYQWRLDGSPVAGVTGATWTLPPAALGRTLSVRVAAQKPGRAAAETVAAAPTAVAPGRFVIGARVTGRAKVGRKLTAVVSGAAGARLSYQWRIGSRAVRTATKAVWRLPRTAAGKRVSVVVRATRTGYRPTSATARHPRRVAR